MRIGLSSVLFTLIVGTSIVGTQVPALDHDAQQTVVAGKCDCSVMPWRPDPPCVRTCSGLLISGVSDQELASSLKLPPETVNAISSMKFDGDLSNVELDKFLSSAEGKLFVAAASQTSMGQLKTLVSTAQRVQPQQQLQRNTLIVTGCIEAGSGGNFMLNNAMTHDTKGASGTSGTTSSMTSSYTLVGGENLKAHVGHRVEVTGTLTGSGSSATATASGSKGQELQIQSVKMVAAACP